MLVPVFRIPDLGRARPARRCWRERERERERVVVAAAAAAATLLVVVIVAVAVAVAVAVESVSPLILHDAAFAAVADAAVVDVYR